MAATVRTSAASKGTLPRAVVIAVGTQEMASIYLPNSTNPNAGPKQTWYHFILNMTESWKSIGMGKHHYNGYINPSHISGDLFFLTYDGGMHTLSSWYDNFGYYTTLLYSSDFPQPFRMQRGEATNWIYPDTGTTTSSEECPDKYLSFAQFVVLSIVTIVFITWAAVSICCITYLVFRVRTVHAESESTLNVRFIEDSSKF